MCGESWVARQRPQRRRGRATVPPVDPAARVRVREAQAAAFAGRASGRGSHNVPLWDGRSGDGRHAVDGGRRVVGTGPIRQACGRAGAGVP